MSRTQKSSNRMNLQVEGLEAKKLLSGAGAQMPVNLPMAPVEVQHQARIFEQHLLARQSFGQHQGLFIMSGSSTGSGASNAQPHPLGRPLNGGSVLLFNTTVNTGPTSSQQHPLGKPLNGGKVLLFSQTVNPAPISSQAHPIGKPLNGGTILLFGSPTGGSAPTTPQQHPLGKPLDGGKILLF